MISKNIRPQCRDFRKPEFSTADYSYYAVETDGQSDCSDSLGVFDPGLLIELNLEIHAGSVIV